MLQLKSLPWQATHSLGPFLLLLIAIFAFIFNNDISQFFIYDRISIEHGQYWRIVTSHFFHTNNNHFYLNGAAVLLLWALHGQFYRPICYLVIYLICAIVCGVLIHLYSLDIQRYVGLSGILHGLFVWGALMDIKNKERTGYILLVGVMLKIAHEQYYGASADVETLIGASVATDAHLFGAIGGLLAYLMLTRFRKN
jgi:rhomboid family GlyGly-CTERM serine protease